MNGFVVRSRPQTDWIVLPLEPRLESWMRRDHPDSVRLRAFVDRAEALVVPRLTGETCGLELEVALPAEVGLVTGGRDLDNYAYPLVSRLGASRIASVFVSKMHGTTSRVRVGAVEEIDPPGWDFYSATTSGESGSAIWREGVARSLLPPVTPLPPLGPVEVEICFQTTRRAWHNDWKATIDGLGTILGYDGKNANDSRITRLGLHRAGPTAGSRGVGIAVWIRSLPE